MGFVHPERDDLFISYAHVNNKPLFGAKVGWVSTLLEILEQLLNEKLGRAYSSRWSDHRLAGNVPVQGEILGRVDEAATILIFLSRGYVESEWCRAEMKRFLAKVQDRTDLRSAVFVVELERLDEGRPPILAELGLRGYHFWAENPLSKQDERFCHLGMPDPNDRAHAPYFKVLNDLYRNLAEELVRQRKARDLGTPDALRPDGRPPVYLAEPTFDLIDERDDVRRYLEQQEIRVLPEGVYPRAPEKFAESARRDLGRSRCFVQLLGKRPELGSPDLPAGYVGLQHDLAKEAGLRILQWRPKLELETVADTAYRARLDGLTVYAEPIEEFKARVVRELTSPPPPPPTKAERKYFVFVNAEASDRPLAAEIGAALKQLNVDHALPLLDLGEDTRDLGREDFENFLRCCDTFLVVYGQSPPTWVRRQLLESLRIAAKRETPFRVIGVYAGPPPPKAELCIYIKNMKIIDCQDGFEEAKLREFFSLLTTEGGR